MDDSIGRKKRSTFKWSSAARNLVAANVNARGLQLRQLITQLVETSGHPRTACRRFARRMGVKSQGRHRRWLEADQQRLLELLDKYSVAEAAQRMRCSPAAVYALLRRLKLSPSFRRDRFSVRSLADLLHTRKEEVDSWVQKGWLKASIVEVGRVRRTLIKPEDFCQFCKDYRETVVGNRLNVERLEFVYRYVFPPDHNQLLSVRQSKKERAAGIDPPASECMEDQSQLPLWQDADQPGRVF